MNKIELDDIDIPKFREYLDEATIEDLTNKVIAKINFDE